MRALLLLLVLIAGAAQAHGHVHVRYVVATGDTGLADACADTITPAVDVGGACRAQVHDGPLRIDVVDDVLGAVEFLWTAQNPYAGITCASGRSDSGAIVHVPDGCERVTVQPGGGATTGTITMTFLS